MPARWPQGEVTKTTLAARDWLQEHRMIVWDSKEQRWGPTVLGVAVMASSMDPDVSLEYIQVCPTSENRQECHFNTLANTAAALLFVV